MVGRVYMLFHLAKLNQINKNSLQDKKEAIISDIIEIIKKRQQEIPPEYEEKWGFFNSIFFAVTVITTIGYGHLSPITSAGKIFCIIFAIFGIPLTGILLAAIGDRFSKCFVENVSLFPSFNLSVLIF